MRILSVLIHGIVATLTGLMLLFYWVVFLKYGNGYYAAFGPLAFTREILIFCSLVGIPTVLFGFLRVMQLAFSKPPYWWVGLRSLANTFTVLVLCLGGYLGGYMTPWGEIARTDWLSVAKNAGKSKNMVPTDARLDFPKLPLQPADNFAWSLKTLDGPDVPFSQFKGKPIFLNFWATWCGPCRAEFPSIQRLYDAMKDKGVNFVFVSREEPDVIRKFLKENNYTFPVYRQEKDPPRDFDSDGIPATFIITADGQLAYRHVGSAAWDTDKTSNFMSALLSSPVPQ